MKRYTNESEGVMNRDIKFRAWDKEKKFMTSVTSINLLGRMFYGRYNWCLFDRVELMQYTGLKDSNGVEIYEGDILSFVGYFNNDYVVYKNGLFYMANSLDSLANIIDGDLKVIGNIHENPELLK